MRVLGLPILLVVITCCSGQCSASDSIPGVGPVGEIKQVSTGHGFLEGPAWDGQGTLYFTDIPKNEILTLGQDGQVQVYTDDSNHANGLMFRPDGQLLACEMDGRLVEWDVSAKRRTVLVSSYGGVRFNACNDLVIDSSGGVYFTDPRFSAPQPLPQKQQGVYYLPPAGAKEAVRVASNLPAPNGILLSIDEKTLYVLPSGAGSMRAFDVKSPGVVSAEREFCRVQGRGGSDGATLDTHGNLYLTTQSGVQVVSPQGEHLGIIELPESPANCTFGGPDRKTLYVTARTSLYAVPMEAAGHVFGIREE